jgi:hypothetical protein
MRRFRCRSTRAVRPDQQSDSPLLSCSASTAPAPTARRWARVAEGTSGGTSMGYFDRYASPAVEAGRRVCSRSLVPGHPRRLVRESLLSDLGARAYPEAPPRERGRGRARRSSRKDGDVDPDGSVVNNLDPPYPPQRVVSSSAHRRPRRRSPIGRRRADYLPGTPRAGAAAPTR